MIRNSSIRPSGYEKGMVIDMMNKNMIKRLKTAAAYQKKAMRALLPESVSGHLETIEQEFKAMAFDLVMEYGKNAFSDDEKSYNRESENSKAKKVDIL